MLIGHFAASEEEIILAATSLCAVELGFETKARM